ncbi:FixH family protein [Paenibacillus piri]|uniref:YtkA-like domain-containing protein n=1 Tax=Paenibacillus piri TaxID=2547395 RepID=A0A4R5KPA2_9BACL|nr:FixH family protein [Paenibacillus piri]TDF97501.1 hypothetical protein E1757_12840 [Paenibacillus piri]
MSASRNRGNLFFCGAAVLAMIAFVGWMLAGAGTGAAAVSDRPAMTESVQGPYTFQVQLNAAEAVVLKPNTFTVTIMRADERPVGQADIDITLYMPDMFCGTSTAKAKEVRPGVYQGDGIPLMAGASAAEVKVQLDGRTYTVQHPFVAAR